MKSWLNNLLRCLQGPHKHTTVDRRLRLCVELLEDRVVPTVNTITVTTASDLPGHTGISLRDAVYQSDITGTVNVINFAPSLDGKKITLVQGVLPIVQSVRIIGPGAHLLTIDGGGNGLAGGEGGSQIFNLIDVGGEGGVNFTVQNLTLAHGNYFASEEPLDFAIDGGGAIGTFNCINTDHLTVQSCILTNNVTDGYGGAIEDDGADLLIQDSVLKNNISGSGGGGAAFFGASDLDTVTFATFEMDRTLVSSNQLVDVHDDAEPFVGGGLCLLYSISSVINNSAILGNFSSTAGGGIAVLLTESTTIQNTTIAGNTASQGIGGLFAEGEGGELLLRSDTITRNHATNGIAGGIGVVGFDAVNIFNTIAEENFQGKTPNDLSNGGDTSQPFNVQSSLIEAPQPGTIVNPSAHHDIVGVPAQLQAFVVNAPLASYTLYTLAATSPALKSGNPALSAGLTTDEIGNARTQTIHGVTYIDMGAVETNLAPRRLHF